MNRRSAILDGDALPAPSPVARKQKRGVAPAPEPGSLSGIAIKREQSRKVDQRREDRHSSPVEGATIRFRGACIDAAVINVSPGGAMIDCPGLEAGIGDALELRFADCDFSPCDVRWIRGHRIGVEFREETTIHASRKVQDFIVRTLRGAPGEQAGGSEVKAGRAVRHRLVWTGAIHFEGESTPARVRNISTDGAMIEAAWDFHVGTALVLDLEEAGPVPATVRWCEGGQIGLKFASRFDLRTLAACKPAAAETLRTPEPPPVPDGYHIPLGEAAEDGPAKAKGRLSLSEVADLYGKGLTRR